MVATSAATGDGPTRPRVTLLAAVAGNGVIGRDGALPWHLSEDLKRFKALTMGHAIVMGRKTHESIGRLLPGRRSIIVTRQPGYRVEGATVAHSLPAALAAARGDDEVFVIGGGEVYIAALPLADRLELTEIGRDFDGDARFPPWHKHEWREVARTSHRSAEGLPFDFVTYDRR